MPNVRMTLSDVDRLSFSEEDGDQVVKISKDILLMVFEKLPLRLWLSWRPTVLLIDLSLDTSTR